MDIFNLLKSILNFYQRQWKFILILLLSGAILGFVYDMVKTPYYETSATVTSGLSYFEGIIDPNELDYPIIDQKIAINMVNALAEIVDKNEYEILAKKSTQNPAELTPTKMALKNKNAQTESYFTSTLAR